MDARIKTGNDVVFLLSLVYSLRGLDVIGDEVIRLFFDYGCTI